MRKDYSKPKYQLGIALQTTRSHPFGKGAFTGRKSARAEVNKLERRGFSDKKIASKAQAIANVEGNRDAANVAMLARERGHEKHEYKMDKMMRNR